MNTLDGEIGILESDGTVCPWWTKQVASYMAYSNDEVSRQQLSRIYQDEARRWKVEGSDKFVPSNLSKTIETALSNAVAQWIACAEVCYAMYVLERNGYPPTPSRGINVVFSANKREQNRDFYLSNLDGTIQIKSKRLLKTKVAVRKAWENHRRGAIVFLASMLSPDSREAQRPYEHYLQDDALVFSILQISQDFMLSLPKSETWKMHTFDLKRWPSNLPYPQGGTPHPTASIKQLEPWISDGCRYDT